MEFPNIQNSQYNEGYQKNIKSRLGNMSSLKRRSNFVSDKDSFDGSFFHDSRTHTVVEKEDSKSDKLPKLSKFNDQ